MNALSFLGQLVLHEFGGIEWKWNTRTGGNLAKISHIFLISISNKWHCFLSERNGECKIIDILESDKSDFYIHIIAHKQAYLQLLLPQINLFKHLKR